MLLDLPPDLDLHQNWVSSSSLPQHGSLSSSFASSCNTYKNKASLVEVKGYLSNPYCRLYRDNKHNNNLQTLGSFRINQRGTVSKHAEYHPQRVSHKYMSPSIVNVAACWQLPLFFASEYSWFRSCIVGQEFIPELTWHECDSFPFFYNWIILHPACMTGWHNRLKKPRRS